MAREHFFTSTKAKIIPFHPSLEGSSGKRTSQEKTPVPAYGP